MGDSPPDESITSDSKASESQIGLNGRPDTLDVNLEIASEHGSERKSPFAEFEETRSGSRTQPSSSLEDLSPQTAEFESFDDDEVQRARKKSRSLAVSLKSKLRELSPSRRSPKLESPKTEAKNKTLGAKSSPKTSTGWLPASFNQIFSNYKTKSTDFRRLFRDLPEGEQLIVDYSCALQRDILVHGRLYMSQNWLCFYANIFGWETFVTIKFVDITGITKEKTALVIPNAIQICTESEKYFFASLVSRDTAHSVLFRIWQNALLDQPLSPQELRNIVGRYEDLHVSSSDDDDESDDDEEEEEEDDEEADEEDEECESESSVESSGTGSNDNDGNRKTDRVPKPPARLPSRGSNTSLVTNSSEASTQKQPATPEGPPAVAVTPPTPQQGPNSLNFDTPRGTPKRPRKTTQTKLTSADVQTKKESSEMEEEGTTSEAHEHVEAPVLCPCEKHWSNHLLKEEYNVNVDTLFEHLFTESDFYKKLQKGRKTKDLKFNPWAETEDGQKRTITYTIALNYPIGPKTSPTTEEQHCLKESVPNKLYVVECEVTNEGIPYGDTFTVCTRYCITKITDTSCKLRVTSRIKFLKSVWGFVKNMIEKNATEGLDGYFKYLGSSLRKLLDPGRRPNRKRKGSHSTRHKRNRSLHDRDNRLASPAPDQPAPEVEPQRSVFFKWMLPKIRVISFSSVRANQQKAFTVLITLLLAALLLVNLSLIRRLQHLESSAHYRHDWHFKNIPADSREWAKLLQQQRHLQQLEMSRWQDILSTSMQLMAQVQRSLEELNAELDRHDTARSEMFPDKPAGEVPKPTT